MPAPRINSFARASRCTRSAPLIGGGIGIDGVASAAWARTRPRAPSWPPLLRLPHRSSRVSKSSDSFFPLPRKRREFLDELGRDHGGYPVHIA